MTGLKESVVARARGENVPFVAWEEWAEGYIKQLEEHVNRWFTSEIWEHDYRCDPDIQSGIDEALRFLRGETK